MKGVRSLSCSEPHDDPAHANPRILQQPGLARDAHCRPARSADLWARLPEVGRSLGKGIVEFKKGLADTGDEIKEVKKQAESQAPRFESTESKKVESQKVESTASSSHE